jgi:hypothetical protein
MALKTYPNVPEFVAMEVASHVAVAADVTAKYYEFSMDRPVTKVIAQIQATTTGVVNAAGLAVTITTVTTEGSESCKVKVAATAIDLGDVINIIAW